MHNCMRKKLDSWGRPIIYKHDYKIETFQKKNETFYYLLGAFITDGNVYFGKRKNAKVSISSKDKDWLQSINKLICEDDLVKTRKSGVHVLNIYCVEIAEILLKNGCHPNKSLTVRLPRVPKKYMRDFLRGCMDGDGSVSLPIKTIKRKYGTYRYAIPTCYLCSASKVFLERIGEYLNASGFKHYFITLNPKERKIRGTTIKNSRPMYRLLFNNNDCQKFLSWIYYPGNKISMPRKTRITNDILVV
jgi:hypothetical protein